MIEKLQLRRDMKTREAVFLTSDTAESETESHAIWDYVRESDEFKRAHKVLIYNDIRGEVPTSALIGSNDKEFIFPLVVGDNLELHGCRQDELVRGYQGILEPSASSPLVRPDEVDMALIPGIAFSQGRDGKIYRMGRGKGFYDRLLPLLDCPVWGVGFSFRLVDELPTDPWDMTLDRLVTGKKVIFADI